MFLTSEGAKMRDEHTRFDIKDSAFACQTVYDAIKKVFGITRSKPTDVEDGAISKSVDRSKTISKDNSMNLGDDSLDGEDSYSYEGAQEFDIKDLMDVEDALLANIKLLVDSCWNDGKALSIVSDSIVNNEKRNPGSVNPIWVQFPEKGKEILTRKLRGIYDGAIEQMAYMEDVIKHKIKDNIKYMKALENGDNVVFKEIKEEEEKVMNALNKMDAKIAYKIGCTYNITGFRELNQQYML